MPKYQLTNKAVEDLENIWDYTFETWSERQADKYYLYMLQCFSLLASKPTLEMAYKEVNPYLLGYKATQHIIFFRVVDNTTIQIIRILHSSMDLKNRILE